MPCASQDEERRYNAKGLDVMRPSWPSFARSRSAGGGKVGGTGDRADFRRGPPCGGQPCLGRRLAYAGAGSSGLMAMADALELPGTYGIAREQIVILIAGGAESLTDLAGGYEDDMELARTDVRNRRNRGGRLPHFGFRQRFHALCDALATRRATRRPRHRHGQQCRRTAPSERRRLHPPGDASGSRVRLDAHGRRDGSEDRVQHALDHGRHPSRPRARWSHGQSACRQHKLRGRGDPDRLGQTGIGAAEAEGFSALPPGRSSWRSCSHPERGTSPCRRRARAADQNLPPAIAIVGA